MITTPRLIVAAGLLASGAALAQASPIASKSGSGWQYGAVLDGSYTSRAPALGAREQGLQLGHSDFGARGPLGAHLRANVVATLETHEGKLETSVEELWIETSTLPAGLQLRAGRFAAQIGYLNQQHPHADDFTERPLLYRAFLGGHWNDDGLRLNWTAPTAVYLMLGAELFRGKKLVDEAANTPGPLGAATLVAKLGADLNRAHSWQLGLSHLRNRREAAVEAAHEHANGADEHAHHHHGAQFSGRKTWMVDATWKWAPNGNNRERQLRLSAEAARISGLNRHAGAGDRHEAMALAAVWRFNPSWELGTRTDRLRVRMPHGGHFHAGLLRERSLMLAWKPTHMQSLRLQLSMQRDAVEFEHPARRALQLQYVLAFGAHGAHSY